MNRVNGRRRSFAFFLGCGAAALLCLDGRSSDHSSFLSAQEGNSGTDAPAQPAEKPENDGSGETSPAPSSLDRDWKELYPLLGANFLKNSGVKALVDAGKEAEAVKALASHFRARTTPKYLPIFQTPLTEPKEGYRNGVADAALRGKLVTRHAKPPQPVTDPIDWTGKGMLDQDRAVLHRHHFIISLADAYWHTRDERYAAKCMELMRSWHGANLFQVTNLSPEPEWRSGLTPGTRIMGWISAFQLCRDAAAVTDADIVMMLVHMARHGKFLSLSRRRGNHGTVTYHALFEIGVMFPELKEGKAWRELADELLTGQLREDVLADGFQLELTPSYHGNVARDFLGVSRLAMVNDMKLSDEYLATVERMFDVFVRLAYPSKNIPLLNDSKQGTPHRSFITMAAMAFNRPDFKFISNNSIDFVADFFGGITAEERARFEKLEAKPPAYTSVALEPSGHYVMRGGWESDDRYLLIEQGINAGWHSHADQLSVDVYGYGRPLVVDPGACHYDDPVFKGWFQTARAHNVVIVEGAEQRRTHKAEVDFWRSTPTIDAFSGILAIPGRGKHSWRRTVVFVKPDYFIVSDEVEGAKKGAPFDGKTVSQLWHHPPGKVTVGEDKTSVRIAFPTSAQAAGNLLLRWPGGDAGALSFNEPKGYLPDSLTPGVKGDPMGKVEATYLSVDRKAAGNRTVFDTLVYPYPGDKKPEIFIHALGGAEGRGVTVRRGKEGERKELVIFNNGQDTAKTLGYEFDGRLAFVRLLEKGGEAGDAIEELVLIGGRRFAASGGLKITAAEDFVALSVRRDADGRYIADSAPSGLKITAPKE